MKRYDLANLPAAPMTAIEAAVKASSNGYQNEIAAEDLKVFAVVRRESEPEQQAAFLTRF